MAENNQVTITGRKRSEESDTYRIVNGIFYSENTKIVVHVWVGGEKWRELVFFTYSVLVNRHAS